MCPVIPRETPLRVANTLIPLAGQTRNYPVSSFHFFYNSFIPSISILKQESFLSAEPRSGFVWQIDSISLTTTATGDIGTIDFKLYLNNDFLQEFSLAVTGDPNKDLNNLLAQYTSPLTYQQSDQFKVVGVMDYPTNTNQATDVNMTMYLRGRNVPIGSL